jgi:hypothetical protein
MTNVVRVYSVSQKYVYTVCPKSMCIQCVPKYVYTVCPKNTCIQCVPKVCYTVCPKVCYTVCPKVCVLNMCPNVIMSKLLDRNWNGPLYNITPDRKKCRPRHLCTIQSNVASFISFTIFCMLCQSIYLCILVMYLDEVFIRIVEAMTICNRHLFERITQLVFWYLIVVSLFWCF